MADDSRFMIERAREGDGTAAEQLLARHLPGLRAYIRLHAGPVIRARESASDLAQSVCLELLRELGEFQYRGEAAFRHWLFTAALRKIQDRAKFYQREKRDVGREVPLDPATSRTSDQAIMLCYSSFHSPSQNAIAREEMEKLEALFDELPPNHREIITLAYVIGLSHKEIAERIDRSESYCRALLSRALARLARLAQERKG